MVQAKTEIKKNTTGQYKSISIQMTEPMKMDFADMELKELMLMVGANGTGKTFVLVCVYVMSYVLQTAVAAKGAPGELLKGVAQFVVDNSYTDKENITGMLTGVCTSGAAIEIAIDKGVVTSVDVAGIDTINTPQPVVYMSSNMRLFSAMSSYLKMRRLIAPGKDLETIVNEMLKSYKLYDVMAVEKLILSMPYEMDDKIRKALAGFDVNENITSFNVDLVQGEFYAIIDADKRKNLSSYGNGHQALFNMTLTQMVG